MKQHLERSRNSWRHWQTTRSVRSALRCWSRFSAKCEKFPNWRKSRGIVIFHSALVHFQSIVRGLKWQTGAINYILVYAVTLSLMWWSWWDRIQLAESECVPLWPLTFLSLTFDLHIACSVILDCLDVVSLEFLVNLNSVQVVCPWLTFCIFLHSLETMCSVIKSQYSLFVLKVPLDPKQSVIFAFYVDFMFRNLYIVEVVTVSGRSGEATRTRWAPTVIFQSERPLMTFSWLRIQLRTVPAEYVACLPRCCVCIMTAIEWSRAQLWTHYAAFNSIRFNYL